MPDQRNLILAIVLSAIVLFGWQYFVGMPSLEQERVRQAEIAEQQQGPEGLSAPAIPVLPQAPVPRAEALAGAARVPILADVVDGSINLTGARLDDLRLSEYRETPDETSPEIELLSPLGTEFPYYVDVGWLPPQGSTAQLPGPQTEWTILEGGTLSPGNEIALAYDGGEGLRFIRRIAVDERYMFTIVDRVENNGPAATVLYPYSAVTRAGIPDVPYYWVVHEGFVGLANGVLQDPSYSDLADGNLTERFASTGGWAGITDKYWMAALIPPQDENLNGSFRAYNLNDTQAYEARYEFAPRTIAPGAAQEVTHRLFAGPKVVNIIEDYRDTLGIARFDYAVDWGWFWFLTKPIFLFLDYLFRFAGNFGIAILLFTILVKLLFFPLANTSYRAMSKMKKLQPELERLRERFKDDKMQQQQAMMDLYKKEKVNPMAGCLPMLVQIPVFFSLYKVLFVTIEMRHAPFYGWIRDLSAPDPTSIFNLFGLIPFTPPQILMIGIWPILMGMTMWLQMSLSPQQPDPVQRRIFAFMPLIFTFMLAAFPAGLVIYWTMQNVLTIAQQIYIMRQTGTPVDAFDRLFALARKLKRRGNPEKSSGPSD